MERKRKLHLFLCVISLGLTYAATIISAQSESHHQTPNTEILELKKGNFSVKLTNWGAAIVSLIVPDKIRVPPFVYTLCYRSVLMSASMALPHSNLINQVLMCTKFFTPFVFPGKNDTSHIGAVVGRVANRIKGAQFALNGTVYKIIANEGNNTLHGFPGDLLAKVTYKIVRDTELLVLMSAKALKRSTPVNLAQHSYWNLGGHNSGTILSNKIKILATHYTPFDSELIPTGEVASVEGTPYDFLKSYTAGSRIKKLPNDYDINYDQEFSTNELKTAAVVHDEKSGRVMQLRTNAFSMQFYTANFLKDVKGKGGNVYQPHAALCLETQGFPDAVNQPKFPSQIIVPGKPYKHVMVYKFSTVK